MQSDCFFKYIHLTLHCFPRNKALFYQKKMELMSQKWTKFKILWHAYCDMLLNIHAASIIKQAFPAVYV